MSRSPCVEKIHNPSCQAKLPRKHLTFLRSRISTGSQLIVHRNESIRKSYYLVFLFITFVPLLFAVSSFLFP